MKTYILSLDESGMADPKTYKYSPYFIVSGCITDVETNADFRIHLSQVKFSTWKENWPDIHLRSQLYTYDKDKNIKSPSDKMGNFCRDLNKFFRRDYLYLLSCLIDKEKAFVSKNVELPKGRRKMKYLWDQKLMYSLSYRYILQNFLRFLVVRNAYGKITAESSTDQQDIILYKEFFNLQTNGIEESDISHKETKKRLSLLSFVTKHNKDPEEEIADIMGFAARLKFQLSNKKTKIENLGDYDKMILSSFEKNLLDLGNIKNDSRIKKIASQIKPFVIIPS